MDTVYPSGHHVTPLVMRQNEGCWASRGISSFVCQLVILSLTLSLLISGQFIINGEGLFCFLACFFPNLCI